MDAVKYPTIWITERRVLSDDTLGGFDIPAGSTVVVSPYVPQRHASHWPDPDAFRLARFLGDHATRTLAKDGYFPFGAGPHQCIGQHFAMMEAKLALAGLLSRFRIHLTGQKFPAPWAGITLRPQSTVPIRLARR